MDVLEIIRTRRSIRRFEAKEVPREALEKVLEAIRWAPSWNNTQCWEVVAVRSSSQKAELLGCMPKFNPAHKAMEEAPVVLVICGRKQVSGYYQGKATTKLGDWLLFDLGLATQNGCLMAHALGLGTVIAGLFDHDRVKTVLGLPADCEAVAMVPMGYPAQESRAPRRREISEFSHEERYA
jgi:nitroreductase